MPHIEYIYRGQNGARAACFHFKADLEAWVKRHELTDATVQVERYRVARPDDPPRVGVVTPDGRIHFDRAAPRPAVRGR